MPKKKTTYEIQNYLKKFNYKLLSDYKNAISYILIQCPENHKYQTKFNYFQQGNRCPYCYGNVTKTFAEIKHFIEVDSNSNYKLLSKKYKNIEYILFNNII